MVSEALQAHPQAAGVQEHGCVALRNICARGDAAGLARKQRVVGAGALEVVSEAMRAHPQAAVVQEWGCWVLRNMSRH